MDGFIFVGTNFRGLNENDTFVGFKICGHRIFLHNSYRKSLIRGHWHSWIGPTRKTIKNAKNWYPTKIKPSTVIAQLVGRQEDLFHPENSYLPRVTYQFFWVKQIFMSPSKLGNKFIVRVALVNFEWYLKSMNLCITYFRSNSLWIHNIRIDQRILP